MSAIPRRELEELIVKYEFHPSIFDTYVEGEFDYAFLTQFIETIPQKTSISVIQIDSIDIPSSYLDSFGLQRGSNKNRVLALARILEARFGVARASNVSCIVDADNDRILNTLKAVHYALYTDFTCMEMYTYDPKTLRKFFEFTCHLKRELVDEFIDLANRVLPAQFAARCANEEMELGVAAPHFTSGLSKKRDFSSFDETKYFKVFSSLLNRDVRQKALELICDCQKLFDKDLRHRANGHDFITLLFEFIWDKDALKLHNKEKDVIRFGGRLFATALEFQQLGNHPLFERIRDSAAGHTYMCPA